MFATCIASYLAPRIGGAHKAMLFVAEVTVLRRAAWRRGVCFRDRSCMTGTWQPCEFCVFRTLSLVRSP